jgi:hemin uptake protein HemP
MLPIDRTFMPASSAESALHQHDASAKVAAHAQPPVPSTALLQGRKSVAIAHNGMLYTLQATKMGKLILTK